MDLVCAKSRIAATLSALRRFRLSRLAALPALFLILAGFAAPTLFAQETPYLQASLEGDYSFVGAYSGDVALLVGIHRVFAPSLSIAQAHEKAMPVFAKMRLGSGNPGPSVPCASSLSIAY